MLIAAICLALILLTLYAFLIEPLLIDITNVSIDIPKLPPSLDGFRICHISDIHCDGYGLLEKLMHRKLAGLDTDLCVITGDIAHSHQALGAVPLILSGLKPRYGFYAVLGNGEHRSVIDPAIVDEKLRSAGVSLLVNANSCIDINDCRISIVGVDDPFLGFDDAEKAYDGADRADFQLLMAHSPDILANLDSQRPDLILAGHTHGGQIRLPWIGAIWDHCRHPYRISAGCYNGDDLLTRGLNKAGSLKIYVSRGLGGRIIHARFLCRPEVAMITIHKKKFENTNNFPANMVL